MSKAIKSKMTDQLAEEFGAVQDCVVLDYRGLDSGQTRELRKRLTRQKAKMRVVRNALAASAFERKGIPALAGLVSGPTAVAYGEDSVAVAKVLTEWMKEAGREARISIRGGMLSRRAIGAPQVEALAALPDRRTMLSQVLATVLAPATHLANLFQSTLTQVPYLLQNHVEAKTRKEPQGAAQAAAAGS